MLNIKQNLILIHDRIVAACTACDRSADSVQLMLATKTQSADTLRQAVACGEHLFGENRVQELVPKHDELVELPITWHFIGHLQTNKVKDVVGRASCIQSVDRISLVEAIHHECTKKQTIVDVMIEVNTSFEESKHGLHPNDVPSFLDLIASYATLRVRGFMTIGANVDDEATVRKGFSILRDLREKSLHVLPEATELSMGMSHDLEWAIAEGATIVRVGSAVFGQRPSA
ncbi:MAG: YggS family pyridoxal phosphate-dependent enzyme [Ignavibacteria bacterium]|nr:YggS family pyridoxal phosphate-dependent enzyme [Ignavibacteria bacterium]